MKQIQDMHPSAAASVRRERLHGVVTLIWTVNLSDCCGAATYIGAAPNFSDDIESINPHRPWRRGDARGFDVCLKCGCYCGISNTEDYREN